MNTEQACPTESFRHGKLNDEMGAFCGSMFIISRSIVDI